MKLFFHNGNSVETYELPDHLAEEFNHLNGLLLSLPPYLITVSNLSKTNKIIIKGWNTVSWESVNLNGADCLVPLWKSFWTQYYLFDCWWYHQPKYDPWDVTDTPINMTAFFIKLKQQQNCKHEEILEWLTTQL